ncbi:MAG: hypothetical protein K2H64_00380 [Desulfovibrio sp.]|nr:hypothetical protein [Desulfovibrio sp.]
MNETFERFLQIRFNSEPWLGGIEWAWQPPVLRVRFIDENLREWFEKRQKQRFEDACSGFFRERDIKIIYASGPGAETRNQFRDEEQEEEVQALFSSFLTGEKNRLALEAAKRAVEPDRFASPGTPTLCFYGEAGSGKTFLLDIVFSALKLRRPGENFLKASSREYCAGAECDDPDDRGAVILDDLQEIEDSPDLQKRLLKKIDAACQRRARDVGTRAFILAFSGSEARLANFDPSLRDRLESGLIIGLWPPDLETRLIYAEKLARELGIRLSKEQTLFIARYSSRFSQISGAMRKIEFFISARDRVPAPAELESLLDSGALRAAPDAAGIIKKVAKNFGLKFQDLTAPSRKPEPLLARQIAMFLLREKLGLSYAEVGELFGGKDHSTAIHAVKKIRKLKDTDKNARELLTKLENLLN